MRVIPERVAELALGLLEHDLRAGDGWTRTGDTARCGYQGHAEPNGRLSGYRGSKALPGALGSLASSSADPYRSLSDSRRRSELLVAQDLPGRMS